MTMQELELDILNDLKELGDANNQHEHPANCRCLLHQKKELQMMTDVPEVPNMNIITFKDEDCHGETPELVVKGFNVKEMVK